MKLSDLSKLWKRIKGIYETVDAAVVQADIAKELTGEEKRSFARQTIKAMLTKRGITISDTWINLAIEIAVAVGKLMKEEIKKG